LATDIGQVPPKTLFFKKNANSIFYILHRRANMLTAIQEKPKTVGVAQNGYTVEEVFGEIENNLIEAFGEGFRKRLTQEKIKRGLLP
jgi:hypothetical protein